MMRNRIKFIFIILISNFYKSQLKPIEYNISNIVTPEAGAIVKYNEFSEPDFIGKKDITIPIYSIAFGDLNIPINIKYNTKGNKVADIATSVGLGWHLEAGGSITQIINDLNDFSDSYSYFSQGGYESEQTYAWHRMSKGYLTPDVVEDRISYLMCGSYRIWDSYDDQIDSAPDFYSVDAPGFSDQFYLNKQNGIITGNFLKFHDSKILNSFNLNPILNCAQFSSDAWGNSGSSNVLYENPSFKLKNESGYIYTFDKSESSTTKEYPGTFISVNGYEVNTWYLTKIESPYSNKNIIFEYEDYTNNYEHLALKSLGNLNVGNYNISKNMQIGTSDSNQFTGLYLNSLTSTIIKPKRLKKIISDQGIIEFKYLTTRLDYAGEALSTIEVKDLSGKNIKTIDFSHSYFSSDCGNNYECQRLKLTSINDSSIGTYRFNYDSNTFPPRNSSKVDYLGYFNNNSSNITFSRNNTQVNINGTLLGAKIYFYPYLQKDNFLPFKLSNYSAYAITDGIDKTPNHYSKLGMLEKIIYPTGGSLNIIYENDDFMYEGDKYLLGSLRIKSLDLRNENNNSISKTSYQYVNENGESSGQINFIKPPTNIIKSEISSGVSLAKNSVIGYSRIIHKTENKGRVEKKFSNFNDYPDVLMKVDQNIADASINNFINFFKFPASYVQSKDNRRGILLEEKIYTEDNPIPVKIITHQYEYNVSDSIKVQKRFTEYTDTNHPLEQYTASNYLLRYFNNVKSTKIFENFNNNILINESQFQYQKARLTYKKTISSGNVTEEYYRNAKDKSIQKLVEANILDMPIETEKKFNGKIISKKEVKYENPADLFPSSQNSYNLSSASMEKEISYDKYDSKGNLLQYTTRNGIPV
ncbi:MAG: hypothetical protein AB7E26_00970, partial [Chryseobacterium sp.]